jgi:hypothetical protein
METLPESRTLFHIFLHVAERDASWKTNAPEGVKGNKSREIEGEVIILKELAAQR